MVVPWTGFPLAALAVVGTEPDTTEGIKLAEGLVARLAEMAEAADKIARGELVAQPFVKSERAGAASRLRTERFVAAALGEGRAGAEALGGGGRHAVEAIVFIAADAPQRIGGRLKIANRVVTEMRRA